MEEEGRGRDRKGRGGERRGRGEGREGDDFRHTNPEMLPAPLTPLLSVNIEAYNTCLLNMSYRREE